MESNLKEIDKCMWQLGEYFPENYGKPLGGAEMGWEEMSTSQTSCHCGKGYITQNHYSDDWNRYEDDPVVIECGDCKKKYIVKEEPHCGMLTSDGSWSEYFLLPIDFPEYNGPSETATYGASANPNWDFTGWLIQHLTEAELKETEEQLHGVKASSKLTGNAAYICKEHKSALKTLRVSAILASVEKALSAYPEYVGNKQQREEISIKEEAAKNIYFEGRRTKRIPINFD